MTTREDLFALIGEDVDFIGDIVRTDVPVLTYRWSNSDLIADVEPLTLLKWGRDAMDDLGLSNVRWQGLHLRGDSSTGQRTKMTVLSSRGESTYVLMTAGLPGTRKEAKEINRQIAEIIERRSRRTTVQRFDEAHLELSSASKSGVGNLTGPSAR